MALTTLDPITAFISIDLQKGIVSLPATPPVSETVRRAAELAAAFRKHKLPVIIVNVAGGAPGRNERPQNPNRPPDWTELVPEMIPQGSDHTVTKKTWGAFTNTDLQSYLRKQGVTQVVIAGVATSIGVESTARYAYELGYNVTLAVDAMSDLNPDAHTNSIERIFPRLGETGTTAEIIALLDKSR